MEDLEALAATVEMPQAELAEEMEDSFKLLFQRPIWIF
jgi:hypothetical protein